ncbi:MAG TPA: putative motility protein [Methylophaga sp.]|nr:putative motility protein [Methylophaga sp.]
MNINGIAQISTHISAQRTATEINVAVLKLGNDQIKAEGQAALSLIQSVPQATASVGNNINIAV